MRLVAAVVALVAVVHAGLWAVNRETATAPSIESARFESLSFAPFSRDMRPDRGDPTTPEQIRSDLAAVAPYTRAVRTYAATGGLEHVPGIAREFGLRVSLGAWVDWDEARNEREVRNVIDLARRHRSTIESIVVGNEVILRDEMTVPELVRYIQRVRRETGLPVTTGEIWNVWLENPELASAVDYLAVHILPYWHGIPYAKAVDQTIEIYNRLRQAFPGKKIVIAEFGWPSRGYNRDFAVPGEIEQAKVIRDFVARADALGIKYNIIEAFDATWKTFEGSVGQYWGVFNADRQLKFPLAGPLVESTYVWKAMLAVLLGLLIAIPIFRVESATAGQALVLAVAANAVGAWGAVVVDYWLTHYFVLGAQIAMLIGLVLLIPLLLIALYRIEELAQIALGRGPRRLLSAPASSSAVAPKVSIHIPAYREPPEMLKQTLDAVAGLDYDNFECIVVINNTPDPAFWEPIEEHCRKLGEKFRFLNVDRLQGFKAGALRLALEHSAADAEIIGILDADYVVHPDWLKDLVPVFADRTVGLVQAPQDHRDGDRSVMHHAMNGEYAGFFDVGMVQRNEHDAIIVHGTMCLIRRAALVDAGGWSSDTICEDSDLGLAIIERGWRMHYTRKRYGWGLLPDTYEAFRKQRHRWAYGGMQIIKKHWRRFLPGASRLTPAQRREFSVGWLSWLGSESVGVAVAILNLLWVPIVLFLSIGIPQTILTVPILATFIVYLVHFAVLYRLRVGTNGPQTAGAAIAAMSVQFTVAKAVLDGIVKDHLGFNRTAKGGAGKKPREFQAFWEAILASLLIAAAAALYMTNWHRVTEIYLYALVLLVQSLPFLSAVVIALVEPSRFNEFAFWRRVSGRVGELLPKRAPVAGSIRVEQTDRVTPVP